MSFTSLSNYHANAAKKQTSGEKPSAGSSPSRKVRTMHVKFQAKLTLYYRSRKLSITPNHQMTTMMKTCSNR